MNIVSRLRVEAEAYKPHAAPDTYEKSLHDDLTEAADLIEAMRDALQGFVDDDDSGTSLTDQRARQPGRIAAAKSAIALATRSLPTAHAALSGASK